MAKTSNRFSGEDFLKKLRNAGDPPTVFTGVVKPAEDDPKSLMFARPGDCAHWVRSPAGAIDHVEPLPSVACGGHSHHMARLQLAQPAAPESKAYAALAQLHRTPTSTVTASYDGGIVCPGGATPYFDAATGQWRCP
jgi:hypothetical protein